MLDPFFSTNTQIQTIILLREILFATYPTNFKFSSFSHLIQSTAVIFKVLDHLLDRVFFRFHQFFKYGTR